MRIVTIYFAAAADGISVQMNVDATLSYTHGTGRYVISTDPAATIANQQSTPAGTGLGNNSLIVNSAAASPVQIFTDFPISAGERLFVSCSAAGSVSLFFTDVT
jgi:hypothetical protein